MTDYGWLWQGVPFALNVGLAVWNAGHGRADYAGFNAALAALLFAMMVA